MSLGLFFRTQSIDFNYSYLIWIILFAIKYLLEHGKMFYPFTLFDQSAGAVEYTDYFSTEW